MRVQLTVTVPCMWFAGGDSEQDRKALDILWPDYDFNDEESDEPWPDDVDVVATMNDGELEDFAVVSGNDWRYNTDIESIDVIVQALNEEWRMQ